MARPSWRRTLLLALKLAVAALLLGWLIDTGRLDFGAYVSLFAAERRGWLAAALVLLALALLLFVTRWHALARVQDIPVGWPDVLRTGLQGQFMQLVVPGGLGTDGLRIFHVRQLHRPRLAAGVASILMDRIVGVVGLLVLGSLACGLLWATTRGVAWGWLFALNAGTLLGVAAVAAALPRLSRLPLRLPERVAAALRTGGSALQLYGRRRATLARSCLWSMAGHFGSGLAAWACLHVLGVHDAPFAGVIAITCVLNLIRMVPTTPLGLGVTDLASEAMFGLLGLGIGAEHQMLVRLLNVGLFVCCGLAFLWGPRRPDRT
jgi:uncharacterized membrane protein YbhN (UPF0104 family)